MKANGYRLNSLAVLPVLALSFSCLALHAQAPNPGPSNGGPSLNFGGFGDSTAKAAPAQRVIQGVVQDKAGQPVKGALVYLKSDRDKSVRSMLTDEKGAYRFIPVSRIAEYTLWAEVKEKRSPQKSVSSFESKNEINRDLKLD